MNADVQYAHSLRKWKKLNQRVVVGIIINVWAFNEFRLKIENINPVASNNYGKFHYKLVTHTNPLIAILGGGQLFRKSSPVSSNDASAEI
jgi:hypothetical protein